MHFKRYSHPKIKYFRVWHSSNVEISNEGRNKLCVLKRDFTFLNFWMLHWIWFRLCVALTVMPLFWIQCEDTSSWWLSWFVPAESLSSHGVSLREDHGAHCQSHCRAVVHQLGAEEVITIIFCGASSFVLLTVISAVRFVCANPRMPFL